MTATHPDHEAETVHGAQPADASVTASVRLVTQQVPGMMPAPAGCAASAVSPSPGGSYSAAEAFRRYGAEGGGGFSLPGAPAARITTSIGALA